MSSATASGRSSGRQKLSRPAAKTARPCDPSRSKSFSKNDAIRARSPFNPSRCSCVSSLRADDSRFSPSASRELTRAAASPAVGETLGSRLTYRLIAQPLSARNAASSRSLSHVTVPAIERLSLPPRARFYASMLVRTVGHGTRSGDELVETLRGAGVETLVDVRRYPGSRRNPQFNQPALAAALADARIGYHHAVELGGRRTNEPGAERFRCIRVDAFRSYAARMTTPAWQDALAEALAFPTPCLLCAETPWTKCYRRLVAELLAARGHDIV